MVFVLVSPVHCGSELGRCIPHGRAGVGEPALLSCAVVALTELPPKARPIGQGQGPGGSWGGFPPAAVTRQCGFLLFNATHSPLPLPEEGGGEKGTIYFQRVALSQKLMIWYLNIQ